MMMESVELQNRRKCNNLMDRPGVGVDVARNRSVKRNEDQDAPIVITLGRVNHILDKKKNSKKKMVTKGMEMVMVVTIIRMM